MAQLGLQTNQSTSKSSLSSGSSFIPPLDYLAEPTSFLAIGMLPFLDIFLDKNPLIRIGPPNLSNITNVAIGHMVSRCQGTDANFNPNVPDYLQYFLEAKQSHPEIVNDGMVMNYLFINLIAGADTTAIAMRAVIYFLLRHRGVYQKLEKEILAADVNGIASYSTAKSLPCTFYSISFSCW